MMSVGDAHVILARDFLEVLEDRALIDRRSAPVTGTALRSRPLRSNAYSVWWLPSATCRRCPCWLRAPYTAPSLAITTSVARRRAENSRRADARLPHQPRDQPRAGTRAPHTAWRNVGGEADHLCIHASGPGDRRRQMHDTRNLHHAGKQVIRMSPSRRASRRDPRSR